VEPNAQVAVVHRMPELVVLLMFDVLGMPACQDKTAVTIMHTPHEG
jgi:hypothetical protein